MPVEKAAAPKRTTKKAVSVTETVKPGKASAAGKKAAGGAPAVVAPAPTKAPAARKAVAPKGAGKTVVAAAKAPGKAAAAPKPAAIAAAEVTVRPETAPAKAPAVRKAATAKPAGKSGKTASATLIEKPTSPSPEERQRWVATAAYHRAEKRGFAPGYEVQDWVDAEADIKALLGDA